MPATQYSELTELIYLLVNLNLSRTAFVETKRLIRVCVVGETEFDTHRYACNSWKTSLSKEVQTPVVTTERRKSSYVYRRA